MATAVNIDGVVKQRPGAYTRVRKQVTAATGPAERGVVALVGTGEGGRPVEAGLGVDDFVNYTDDQQARTTFRSGDLLEASLIAFTPANDEEIPAGAQRIYAMKVNPATQSERTFYVGGVSTHTVTSADYGAFTEQISVQHEAGTEANTKQVTVAFEDTTEELDNIGGTAYFDMRYREGGSGWDNVLLQVLASGIRANASRREAGLAGDVTSQITLGATVTVSSSDAADTRAVTLYGTDTGDDPQTETLTLNGTTDVVGTKTWNRVFGASLPSVLAGATVTIEESTAQRNIATTAATVVSNVLQLTVASGHGATVGMLATVADLTPAFNIATPTAITFVDATHIHIPLTHIDETPADELGTVTVNPQTFTLVNPVVTKGVVLGSAMFVAKTSLMVRANNADVTGVLLLFGKSITGADASESITLTGLKPLETATDWSQITAIALEDVATGRAVHISGTAAETTNSVQNTIQKAADYFNAKQVDSGTPDAPNGFQFTIQAANTAFLIADLDFTQTDPPTDNADITLVLPSGVDVKTATASFNADLYAVLSFFGAASTLTSAARIDFAPKTVEITITAENNHPYVLAIDGFSIDNTNDATQADGSATTAEVQTLLINAIQRDHRVNSRVSAVASGTTKVIVTGDGPSGGGFSLTESDDFLTLSTTQSEAGAGIPSDNDAMPVFLSGGEEGTVTDSDWQTAFDLLELIRVDTIVPLTGDPAIHALLRTHLIRRAGPKVRSEADGKVGLSALDVNDAPTGVLPDKTSIKAQIQDLNTRHVTALAQEMTRFDSNNDRRDFEAWFLAAAVAGMQAGAPTGTPLTNKTLNALGVKQDASWGTLTHDEEMLTAGLCFFERRDNVGIRMVRNITTYTKSSEPDDLVYIESSVNDSVNEFTYELRTRVERAVVGHRGDQRIASIAKSTAIRYASQQAGEGGLLDSFDPKSLKLRRVADAFVMSLAAVFPAPVNFADITINVSVPVE